MIEEQVKLSLRRNIRALQRGAMIATLAALPAMGMALQNAAAQEINGGAMASSSQINLIDRMRDIETTVKARVPPAGRPSSSKNDVKRAMTTGISFGNQL